MIFTLAAQRLLLASQLNAQFITLNAIHKIEKMRRENPDEFRSLFAAVPPSN